MSAVTMNTGVASTARVFLLRLCLAVAIVLVFTVITRAGGPKCTTGTSYFDPTVTGQALSWPMGQIT